MTKGSCTGIYHSIYVQCWVFNSKLSPYFIMTEITLRPINMRFEWRQSMAWTAFRPSTDISPGCILSPVVICRWTSSFLIIVNRVCTISSCRIAKKNFATDFVVGYPPCPYLTFFKEFITARYRMKVVIGTHPIPQKYYDIHQKLQTWDSSHWKEIIQPALTDEKTRRAYD